MEARKYYILKFDGGLPIGDNMKLNLNRILLLIIILSLTSLYSCKNDTDFNSAAWKTKDGITYPYRDKIYGDLLKKHNIRGYTYKQVVKLLGDPDYDDTIDNRHYIYYEILTDFGSDIDPVYTKTLVIELDSSRKVKNYKVEEWRKNDG